MTRRMKRIGPLGAAALVVAGMTVGATGHDPGPHAAGDMARVGSEGLASVATPRAALASPHTGAIPWGASGHEMAARAAHLTLPAAMPAFFREAGEQLVYLDPEPDRWRDFALTEMDQAWSYDHYIDFENVPDGALDAPDRFVFLKALYDAGLAKPERDAGFLPYRIIELYQRTVTGWRRWRTERDPEKRAWIEQRIINDAGILGHYVTDGSQPHHTTIHFNGWSSAAPNPEGYTSDRTFHARFESDFVEAFVTQADVSRRIDRRAGVLNGAVRPAVFDYLRHTFSQVEPLYRMDRDVGFDADGPLRSEARDFAADRLADGAGMLAVLWRSAWEESAR